MFCLLVIYILLIVLLKNDVADKFYDITCLWMIFCSFKECSPDWPVNTQNSRRKQEKQ